jgi:hypothetical protein
MNPQLIALNQIVFSVSAMVFVGETYTPVLLSRKAAELRHATRNWGLHSKHEEWNVSIRELARKYLIRPFLLMINPTCFLVSSPGHQSHRQLHLRSMADL